MVYLESTYSIAPPALLKHNNLLLNIFLVATWPFINQQVIGMDQIIVNTS